MAHVVCEPCHDCKYTDCVVVCPVECFFEDGQMVYINPNDCTDCDACVMECPTEAYADVNVPERWRGFIALNAERSAALVRGGHIIQKQMPLVGAGCVRQCD